MARCPLPSVLLITCTLALLSPARLPAQDEHTTRVENGLVPPVLIKGAKGWNILDRMKHYNVPGVSIAVFADHRLVWAKGYGTKDVDTGEPVTPATLFVAGSVSKPVAIMGALRLVREGKLTLDGNINTFLRSWKLPENELTRIHSVTLRLLASHNAGTTVHGFEGYAAGQPVPATIQTLDGVPPSNSPAVRVDLVPGTQWRYSGGGTTVVQLAMCDVTQKPFAQLMRELVLEPAGMTNSSYEQSMPTARLSLAASGHDAAGRVIPGKRHVYPEMAAAGLWTTATDLIKFAIEADLAALGRSSSILTQDLARLMVFPRIKTSGRDSMALGFFLEDRQGIAYFGHGGADAGFICRLTARRGGGYGAAVMTNSDGRPGPLIDEILRSVAREYGWEGYLPPEVEVITLDSVTLDRYAGRYGLSSDNVLTIRRENEGLVGQESMGQRFTLLPISTTTFVRIDRDLRYTFLSPRPESASLVLTTTNSSDTARRVKPGFQTPLEVLRAGKTREAIDAYRAIHRRDPGDLAVNEVRLNSLGYEFVSGKQYEEAIAVFSLNVELYPASWNVYDSLGEAYMYAGKRQLAIDNYERSLQLHPKNENGRQMLERLRSKK